METFSTWCWINILRLIKQQNLNSQKVNGMGITTSYDAHIITEDNIQGLDGYVGINDNDNVRTLGLQNFYGHIWNFLDNVMVRSNGKVWIKKDFTNTDNYPTYSNTVPNGWEELDVVLPTANKNLVSEIALNSYNSWALYPSKLGGSDVEPIGDVCWNIPNEPFSVVVVGGSSWEGSFGGALCWFSHYSLSIVNVKFCGRSLEIVL